MKNKLKLAIFDVDGLILDSEAFYANAWADAFNEFSQPKYKVEKSTMINWFYNNLSGKKIGNQLDFIQQTYPNNDIVLIYEEYRKLFKTRQKTEKIEILPGFFELIEYLKEKNIILAISTTSRLESIQNEFKNANIDINDFKVIVSGEMVKNYKPNPEPYSKVCELLNIKPNEAISFEDSNSGVLSSTSAGVKCFLIPGRAPVSANAISKAYKVSESLLDTISIINKEFNI